MPTTEPVYGWPLPEDTDPVADGASAIRSLAGGISASLRGAPWAQAWPSADQTLGADGWSQVVLGSEQDPYNMVAGSAVTLPDPGPVWVGWGATVALSGAAPAAVNIASAVYRNGAEWLRGSSMASSSSPTLQSFGSAGSGVLQAAAGDVLTLCVFVQVPGSAKTVVGPGTRLAVAYFNPQN